MKYKPLHKCSICKNLSEDEYGHYSVMSGGPYSPLPQQANKLRPIEELDTEDKKKHHVKQCPICGVYYQYDEHYDYDVTGSSDEIYLTRLTPTEVKGMMKEREYNKRLRQMEEELKSTHLVTKRYAAKGLASYYLEQETAENVIELLESNDDEIGQAILSYLDRITEKWWRLNNPKIIEHIATTTQKNERYKDNPLVKQIIWRCGLKE